MSRIYKISLTDLNGTVSFGGGGGGGGGGTGSGSNYDPSIGGQVSVPDLNDNGTTLDEGLASAGVTLACVSGGAIACAGAIASAAAGYVD